MQGQKRRTLAEWEEQLTPLFKEIRLISEVPLGDFERVQLAQRIRTLIKAYGLTRATEYLEDRYPRAFVTYLALTAARNEERGFWAVVAREMDINQAGQFLHPNHHWGQLFVRLLETLGLETFADIPTGREYVTRIRLHGGIPAYSLDDFFAYILMPAVERKEFVGLPTNTLLSELLSRSEVRSFADQPVRLFLQEGGETAHRFFEHALRLAQIWQQHREVPPSHEVGLPPYVVDRFQEFVEHRPFKGAHRRLRPPILSIDPEADDTIYLLDLPSQMIPLTQAHQRYFWRWEVKTPDGHSLFEEEQWVRVRRQGEQTWTQPLEAIPLVDIPPGRLTVTFFSRPVNTQQEQEQENVVGRWHFPLAPDTKRPLLAFRATDGRFIRTQTSPPADVLLLLLPAEAQLHVIGKGRQTQKFPDFYGDWSAWRLEEWDLTEAQGIKLLDAQGGEISTLILASKNRAVPELRGRPAPWQEFDPEERPLFVGTPPELWLPRTAAVTPHEEMARWGVRLHKRRHTGSTPITKWLSVRTLAKYVRVEEEYLVLPLHILMEKGTAGIFEVEVHGPIRPPQPLVFRFWPDVRVEDIPPYVLPGPHGHTNTHFYLRVPPECTVRVQEGEEDVEVIATEQPGRFRVRMGPKSNIAPLRLVQQQNETTLAEVPVHIGIPRLRWLLDLEEADVPQPQGRPMTRSVDAFLQHPHVFLILEWRLNIAPDALPEMRIALVDPNLRPPRLLQESDSIPPPREGRHRQIIHLGPFRDTVRAHKEMPLLRFDLLILEKEPKRFPLVHLTRTPEIEAVHLEWRADGKTYIHWRELRPLRHRRITLWPASQPWHAPVQWAIPDTVPRSDRYPEEGWWMIALPSEHTLPPGAYWVAFHTAHEWEPLQPEPHPPNEAFLVMGVNAHKRLRELAESASAPADEFLRHFERAAWYDCLQKTQLRDEEVQRLFTSLEKAHPEHIVALAHWLEPRNRLKFKEILLRMYKPQLLEQKCILSAHTPADIRRKYMQWFTQTRLIYQSTAIRVLDADVDIECKAHALSILIKHDIREGVFYGLWLLEQGLLSVQDIASIFQTAADAVVQELRTTFSDTPEAHDLIEALLPFVSNKTVYRKHARIAANTKHDLTFFMLVGHIAEVLVNDEPKSFAFPDEENIILRIHLDGLDEHPISAEIDVTNKKIRFITKGKNGLYCCTTCKRFIAASQEHIYRHHSLKHAALGGKGASFIPLSVKANYTLIDIDDVNELKT